MKSERSWIMFDKVTEILDGYTEVRKEEMTPDMLLVDDLGLNSVSYFAIVFDLEDAAVSSFLIWKMRLTLKFRMMRLKQSKLSGIWSNS